MAKLSILCSLMLVLLGTPCRTSAVGPTAPTGTRLGRAASAAGGTTYYVAPSGNDSNPGTIAQPWRTIQKAADTMVAGDTVYIRAGTFPEQVIPHNSGNAGQPVSAPENFLSWWEFQPDVGASIPMSTAGACGSEPSSPWRWPATPVSSSPTNPPRHWT